MSAQAQVEVTQVGDLVTVKSPFSKSEFFLHRLYVPISKTPNRPNTPKMAYSMHFDPSGNSWFVMIGKAGIKPSDARPARLDNFLQRYIGRTKTAAAVSPKVSPVQGGSKELDTIANHLSTLVLNNTVLLSKLVKLETRVDDLLAIIAKLSERPQEVVTGVNLKLVDSAE